MINWQFFPQSVRQPIIVDDLVGVFEAIAVNIESGKANLKSNAVLEQLRPGLLRAGFQVELGKTHAEQIRVPVLIGRNGKVSKSFHADAYHPIHKLVLEVEAGRGVANNQFLKDLFQACMMQEVDYLAIAVCNQYGHLADFEAVIRFFETLYASRRLVLPLRGVLIIGY